MEQWNSSSTHCLLTFYLLTYPSPLSLLSTLFTPPSPPSSPLLPFSSSLSIPSHHTSLPSLLSLPSTHSSHSPPFTPLCSHKVDCYNNYLRDSERPMPDTLVTGIPAPTGLGDRMQGPPDMMGWNMPPPGMMFGQGVWVNSECECDGIHH